MTSHERALVEFAEPELMFRLERVAPGVDRVAKLPPLRLGDLVDTLDRAINARVVEDFEIEQLVVFPPASDPAVCAEALRVSTKAIATATWHPHAYRMAQAFWRSKGTDTPMLDEPWTFDTSDPLIAKIIRELELFLVTGWRFHGGYVLMLPGEDLRVTFEG